MATLTHAQLHQQNIATKQAARTAAIAKRSNAIAQREQARQARIAKHEQLHQLHQQQHQPKSDQLDNNTSGLITSPTTAVQPGTGLSTPDQTVVPGGYVGSNLGTNDTGGITLGNGTGDITTPSATNNAPKGLSTLNYIELGVVGVIGVFLFLHFRKVA